MRIGAKCRWTMPLPLEYSDRPHHALLWMATGEFDDQGQMMVADDPVELKVRWLESLQEQIGPQGTMRIRIATVVVDRDIPPSSRMWRGRLIDWLGTGSGDDSSHDSEVMEVVSSNDYPDLKGRLARKTVTLHAGRQM